MALDMKLKLLYSRYPPGVIHGQTGPETENSTCVCPDLNPVLQLLTSSVTATLKYFCNCPHCICHKQTQWKRGN